MTAMESLELKPNNEKKPKKRLAGGVGGLNNKMIAEAYNRKNANLASTAASLNVSRSTLAKWRREDKELNQMLTEVEESLLDYVETELKKQVFNGNLQAMIFFLKSKAKERGFVEGHEIRSKVEVNYNLISQEEAQRFIRRINATY